MVYASEYRTDGSRTGQAARCRRHQKKQAPLRPAFFARHGFLNHAFKPLTGKAHKELRDRQTVESDFFQSLNHLADFYHCKPLNPAWTVYPYSLYVAFEQAEKDMAAISKSLKLKVMQ